MTPSFLFIGLLLVATGFLWMLDNRGSPALWVFGFSGVWFGLGVLVTGVIA